MLNPGVNMTSEITVEGNPESLVDSLVDVLWKEVEVYRELRESVSQEHRVLLKPSLEAIHASNARKETCLLKTRLLEEVRAGITHRLCRELGIGQEEITLTALLSHVSPRQRKPLAECQAVLRSLVTEITGMNRRNGLLIESSIQVSEGVMQFFTNVISGGSTYAESGQLKPRGLHGRICSSRG
jgi:flagellar biosynthesis/type III secretory pathway chaperone